MTRLGSEQVNEQCDKKALLIPDQQLAEKISDDLITKGLITAEKRKALLSTLSVGRMKSEDWRNLAAGAIHTEGQAKGVKP